MTTLHVAASGDLDIRMLYAILRLRAEVFVVEQDCAYQDVDGRDLEPATHHVWLASGDAGDQPIAYLRILAEPGGGARIGRVCVAPAARRAGHAATLLAAALEIIGDHESVLAAQAYATGLYTAAGFAPDGPEYDEDGIAHVPMRRAAPIA